MKDIPDGPKGKETQEVEDVAPVDGLKTFIVLKEITPTVENKWSRNNIFYSTHTVKG